MGLTAILQQKVQVCILEYIQWCNCKYQQYKYRKLQFNIFTKIKLKKRICFVILYL